MSESPLFNDFDFWGAFEAGHVYSKNLGGASLIAKMKETIKDSAELDAVLFGHNKKVYPGVKDASGIPHVGYEADEDGSSPADMQEEIEADSIYFSDSYEHPVNEDAENDYERDAGGWKECGFFPFDFSVLQKNLAVMEEAKSRRKK